MSDTKDDKIIGVKIKLSECEHGKLNITGVEPIRESSVAYSAPDADKILRSPMVGGGNRLYAENWDRNFGPRTKLSSDDEVN